jgi:hypothetical protein
VAFLATRGYDRSRGYARGQVIDMMRMLIGALLLGVSATTANAIDLHELAPCRPAAARLCDRSGGMTYVNLIRCGATLAANSAQVGSSCRRVLRRYGQL